MELDIFNQADSRDYLINAIGFFLALFALISISGRG